MTVELARTSLTELALLFVRLGATAFGGPAVHVAIMQEEVVVRRKWLTEERFLDLLGATNLIPGPNSTEMAIHIGFERRRWAGLVVAGVAFIVPAMLITAALGWVYVRYGTVPSARWLLYGVKPVILGIVVQAILGLAPKAAKTGWLRALGVVAVAAYALGVHELAVLFGAGVLTMVAGRRSEGLSAFAPVVPGLVVGALAPSLSSIFLVFLKIGSVLFGSGYVLLAFLRSDLVLRLHWLTEAQLLDAVAVGQITPGPVFTTATFVGWLLAGWAGALVATLGIFLPAFVFVAISGPLVPRLRRSPAASAFLDGVNVASLALMAVVTAQLARAALVDRWTIALGLVAAVLLVRFKVGATTLIALGAGAGFVVHRLLL